MTWERHHRLCYELKRQGVCDVGKVFCVCTQCPWKPKWVMLHWQQENKSTVNSSLIAMFFVLLSSWQKARIQGYRIKKMNFWIYNCESVSAGQQSWQYSLCTFSKVLALACHCFSSVTAHTHSFMRDHTGFTSWLPSDVASLAVLPTLVPSLLESRSQLA